MSSTARSTEEVKKVYRSSKTFNPRTDGGLGQLRTDVGGGGVYSLDISETMCPSENKKRRKFLASSTITAKVIFSSGKY